MQEAARRATVTAERALEMEAQLSEAEQRAADTQKLAQAEQLAARTETELAEA